MARPTNAPPRIPIRLPYRVSIGINEIDFLVTPRVIALIVMMPMLTLYGSLMGILGGAMVGLAMLDVSLVQYVEQTIASLKLNSLSGGSSSASSMVVSWRSPDANRA